MRLHRLAVVVATLFAAVGLALGEPVPAWAAIKHPATVSGRALPAASITSKVTLPETSIDGPALDSVFFAHIGIDSAIGWTGTDPDHHLNVETGGSGLQFEQKLTLPETSPFRPDVALSAPGGPVSVAWTGTDPNHLLNVLYDVYGKFGSPKKLTLPHDTSIAAPALLESLSSPGTGGAPLYLAWTGTDPNHSLNILPITVTAAGLVPGQKTVLSQFSSDAGPHLTWRGLNTPAQTVVLNWTTRALQLTVATSPDGITFSPAEGAGLPETSGFAPHTDSFPPFSPPSNREWIGWTGTDPAHHLNLQWTTTFPQFTDPGTTKTTLDDTALGGPALAFNGDELIAWTGTNLDTAHHLNIAAFNYL